MRSNCVGKNPASCDASLLHSEASLIPLQELKSMSENEVTITVRPNGPFRVEGPCKLLDADGKEWDLTGKPAFSLCRCGGSTKKPFCDGTHSKIGFQAAEAAVAQADAQKQS